MLLFFCKYRCFCAIKISANFGVSEEEVHVNVLHDRAKVPAFARLVRKAAERSLKWVIKAVSAKHVASRGHKRHRPHVFASKFASRYRLPYLY